MSFVSASIQTDPGQITDDAIDQANATLATNGLPGWTAQDTTLAVILLTTIAQIAADVASVAATVVPAIFRAFGTLLLNIPYQNGQSATVLTTWTFTSPSPAGGYTIDAATTIVIDGYAFYIISDYTSSEGDTTASILVQSAQAGTAFNNLGGVNQPAFPNDQIDWVAGVVTQGVTSNGQDQQSDADYQNQLAAAQRLQAPRPLVDADFAEFVQTDIAEIATGVAVARATAIDGYYPDGRALSSGGSSTPTVLTCVLTSASPTVQYTGSGTQVPEIGATVSGTGVPASTLTATTVDGSDELTGVSAFTALGAGTEISGIGIPAGASILSVNTGASTAIMSQEATANGTGITLTPTQTVLGSPAPTDISFTISVNASTSASESLTVSALSGYGPPHLTCVGSTTSSSEAVTITTGPYLGAIPDVGARVTGTAIPTGATVAASPAPTAAGFHLSANATSNETNETITISSWTSVALADCTFVTDPNGNQLPAAAMDAELAFLETYRPQNWLLNVVGPSYSTIYITCLVAVLPTADETATGLAVQAALLAWLNPLAWGNAIATTTGVAGSWLNSEQGFNEVREKQAIAVATQPGVAYVDTLTLGFSPSPGGTSDLVMPGPAPLPLSTEATIIVTTEAVS